MAAASLYNCRSVRVVGTITNKQLGLPKVLLLSLDYATGMPRLSLKGRVSMFGRVIRGGGGYP